MSTAIPARVSAIIDAARRGPARPRPSDHEAVAALLTDTAAEADARHALALLCGSDFGAVTECVIRAELRRRGVSDAAAWPSDGGTAGGP